MRNQAGQESFEVGSLLLAAAAGAIVGAGVALLLAPKAGADVREDLGASFAALREAAKRRYRDLADAGGVQVDNLEAKAEEFAGQLETSALETIDAAASQAHQAATRLREGARSIVNP